jgi:hypothetical protein
MADSGIMNNLISTFKAGSYISTDNLAAIEGVRNNMNSFYNIISVNFAADASLLDADAFSNI